MEKADIYRSAKLYIDQYGLWAEYQAGNRAAECKAKGDTEGERVWKAIFEAIDEVRRIDRRDGEAIH
jgi:D-Tyr-tRNAtyr deacylase